MKRFYIILICSLIIIIVASILINFYLTHKTRYLNYYYTHSAVERISYIELGTGIRLKGYADQTIFTDKRIIKKVMDYLNSIPLLPAPKDTPVPHNIRKDTIIGIYDEEGFETGWVIFGGENYIRRSLDGKLFKARDEETKIISGLEELDLD